MVGQLQRGESILIHAGSGGVGQAAINVALHYGCEVFTTVGTAEKRAFIKKLFPQLKGINLLHGMVASTYFNKHLNVALQKKISRAWLLQQTLIDTWR